MKTRDEYLVCSIVCHLRCKCVTVILSKRIGRKVACFRNVSFFLYHVSIENYSDSGGVYSE